MVGAPKRAAWRASNARARPSSVGATAQELGVEPAGGFGPHALRHTPSTTPPWIGACDLVNDG